MKRDSYIYICYNVLIVILFVSCQFLTFSGAIGFSFDVVISVMIVVVACVVFWTIGFGMSGGCFATDWTVVLYAIPLDMVWTAAFKASDRSRGGRWSDSRRAL